MDLFDFTQPGALDGWTAQGAAAIVQAAGAVVYQGGEGQVLSPALAWDLGAFNGIRLRVRGDGGRYGLMLHCSGRGGLVYRGLFEALTGEWSTVTLAFGAFKPQVRGSRWLRRFLPRVNARAIVACGFACDAVVFRLEIERVWAYEVGAITDPIPVEFQG